MITFKQIIFKFFSVRHKIVYVYLVSCPSILLACAPSILSYVLSINALFMEQAQRDAVSKLNLAFLCLVI